jgi:hypothetical protein
MVAVRPFREMKKVIVIGSVGARRKPPTDPKDHLNHRNSCPFGG